MVVNNCVWIGGAIIVVLIILIIVLRYRTENFASNDSLNSVAISYGSSIIPYIAIMVSKQPSQFSPQTILQQANTSASAFGNKLQQMYPNAQLNTLFTDQLNVIQRALSNPKTRHDVSQLKSQLDDSNKIMVNKLYGANPKYNYHKLYNLITTYTMTAVSIIPDITHSVPVSQIGTAVQNNMTNLNNFANYLLSP